MSPIVLAVATPDELYDDLDHPIDPAAELLAEARLQVLSVAQGVDEVRAVLSQALRNRRAIYAKVHVEIMGAPEDALDRLGV